MEKIKNSMKLPYVDTNYKGELKVIGILLKYKQSSGIGALFKSFVKRFFVLDINNFTFGYYRDFTCKTGAYLVSLAVPLEFNW